VRECEKGKASKELVLAYNAGGGKKEVRAALWTTRSAPARESGLTEKGKKDKGGQDK